MFESFFRHGGCGRALLWCVAVTAVVACGNAAPEAEISGAGSADSDQPDTATTQDQSVPTDTAAAADTIDADQPPTDAVPTDLPPQFEVEQDSDAADSAGPDGAMPDGAMSDGAMSDSGMPDSALPDSAETSEDTTTELPNDTTIGGGVAEVVPETAGCKSSADCPQPAAGCLANVCVAGGCIPQPQADGTPCNDTSKCTAKAACAAGKCTAVAPLQCSDGKPCTTDGCDPAIGCTYAAIVSNQPCNDGDSCIADTACDGQGNCAGGKNVCGCKSIKDCAVFDDGDSCNGTLYCNNNLPVPVCQVLPNSVVLCDAAGDTACAKQVCNSQSGQCAAVFAPTGSACADDNPCTQSESCVSGACVAAVNVCQCQISADCLTAEDGNVCNGTLYCDVSAAPFTCKVNPASLVSCPKPTDSCKVAACLPGTGSCKLANAANGTPCDDGNAKTVGDACEGGQCQAGTNLGQCKGDTDCAKFEDGDYCNGVLFCNKALSLCQLNPATKVSCPSVNDTACQKNQCEPTSGLCALKAVNDKLACNDGNPCTVGEVCLAGQCAPSADICQCQTDKQCASKDDGNLCNGILFCDKATGQCKVNPASIVVCSSVDNSTCATNGCNPKSGACTLAFAATGTACDDDNTCTADDACGGGQCQGTKTCSCSQDADCAGQEDGDLCNGTLYCNKKAGKCELNQVTVKVCPTVGDSVCSKNQCQPSSGQCAMVSTFNGAACNADDNPCTPTDYCDLGACKSGKNVCDCQVDSDCTGKQGADKCVLDLFCDKGTNTCKPFKMIQCDTSLDGPCRTTTCNPATGQCQTQADVDSAVCGEGSLCAGVQVCLAGDCVTGTAADCSDADACSADACDPKQGCVHTALSGVACDDGNICTASDNCNVGNCVGTAKDCSDDSPCTADACDPAKGCVYLPGAVTVCSDGDLCSVGDFCLGGLCLSGSKVLPCNDANPCTTDSCDPKQGCTAKVQDGSKCDDGDGCTKLDACQGGGCKGLQLSCDDGSGCTIDSCDKDEGCKHQAQVGKACDDGNACTVADACIGSGLCASGQSKLCDDANPCTVDLCDPLQGCVTKELVGNTCDDSNACTVNEKCAKGQCTGSPRDCDDGLMCSKDTCDKNAGCLHAVVAGSKCDDGSACTTGDICAKGGACVPGAGLSCDDGNGCTVDACDPAAGCTQTALDGIACSDGDACTQADKCAQGQCKGQTKPCDDGLACTSDGCDAVSGCSHSVAIGAVCSDNDACTAGDACLTSGYCKPGATVNCDDSNACTADVCSAKAGCASTATTGKGCDDGTACTNGDTCQGAVCAGSPLVCDDDQPCTKDSCDKGKGCQHLPTVGAQCSDGNACSQGDVCNKVGTCAPGKTLTCQDGKTCTADSCDVELGCTNSPLSDVGCDDADACTKGDVCSEGSCKGTVVGCDDGEVCTSDSCDKAKACVFSPVVGKPCNDGNACLGEDLCSGGKCAGTKAVNCDDSNLCTLDLCNAGPGCSNTKLAGAACDDGKVCTGSDSCANGVCLGLTLSCNDGNDCTDDSCSALKGCVNTASTKPCNDGDECTVSDACKDAACAGSKKDCSDGNDCTVDSCNKFAGCLSKNAPAASKCDDSDGCTVDTCDGLGTCQTTPELWAYTLPTGFVAMDMVGMADGSALVVGASASAATGAFVQRFVPGSKQPLPQNMAFVNEWRRIVALANGSYIVAGARYVALTQLRLYHYSAQGAMLAFSEGPVSGPVLAEPYDALVLGKQYVAAASPRRRRAGDDNGVVVVHFALGSLQQQPHVLWKAPGADGYSRIDINGMGMLADDTAVVVATVSQGTITTVYQIQVTADAKVTSWPMLKLPGGNLTTHMEGKQVRVWPNASAGLTIFLPKSSLHESRLVRVDATGGMAMPDGPIVFNSLEAGVLRANHIVAASGKVLVIADRSMRFAHAQSTLANQPAMLRLGTKRTILSLAQVPTSSGSIAWQLQRLDPWGNDLCNGCFTVHAQEGCAKPETASTDTCNANGNCAPVTYPFYCTDGDACTVDTFDNKTSGCTSKAQVGEACGLGPFCQINNGVCATGGGCVGTPGFKSCDDGNPCTDDLCYGTSACKATPLPSGAMCGDGASCSAGGCVGFSAGKVTLAPAQPGNAHVPFLTDPVVLASFNPNGKKVRWVRVKVAFEDTMPTWAGYNVFIELVVGSQVIQLYGGQVGCEDTDQVSCLPWWDTPAAVYPAPNRGATWVEAHLNLAATSTVVWQLQVRNHPNVWGYRYVKDWLVEYD